MASPTSAEKRVEVAEFLQEATHATAGTWFLYLAARRAFGSDAELARVLDVHRSQVARWKRGGSADPANEDRLRNLGTVVDSLTGYLDTEIIPDWLAGANPHLGHRRPIDVLLSGRITDVIAAVEAEKRSAHA